VIDPGPDLPRHVRAVVHALEGAERIHLLLTHGHADHAGAVESMMALLPDAMVIGPGHPASRPADAGEEVHTDAGSLSAFPTPGHTRDHVAWLWPETSTLFVGDLVLGRGDTTWVGEYPGCVADYLDSLNRVEALAPDRLLPAHGAEVLDPPGVLAAYRAHRRERIAQVRRARAARPGATASELLADIYGDGLPEALERAARASLEALVEYVEDHPQEER
jgi:glyoxylase-like metal-dependent hydrolase (beta-lactamase superfamily II)